MTRVFSQKASSTRIQPEGLLDYKVPPPSVLDPAPAPPISLPSTDNENDTDGVVADDFDGEEEENVQVVDEQEEGERNIFDLLQKELL